jgi:LysR family transcriptional regulator, chromosome initiation inhibitor
VQFDGQQLVAFAAVIEHGSFDAAAASLHVTPSAVSQRIKGLEQRVGQVLVLREKPCTATAAGTPLLRLAAQTVLLEAEALAEMGGGGGSSPRIAVAVNADSMATWFTGVFERLDDVLFDIRIEDQDHSARLLREGVVMGAVTTERTPVTGCRVRPLGVMRYVPVASPAYIERYLHEGFTAHAVATAPSLAWNRDDALQDMLVRKVFRRDVTRPQHFVPTAEGFRAAVCTGLGWGMFPDSIATPNLDVGSFVRVCDAHLDVPLFWQCWKLDSPMVVRITDVVRSAAADLRPRKSLGRNARREPTKDRVGLMTDQQH